MTGVDRWSLGGDPHGDPFNTTLDLWSGEHLLAQVPLVPAVVTDLDAALRGVANSQREAMGLAPLDTSADAGVEPTGWLRSLTRGWRFAVVLVTLPLALIAVVAGLIPAA